MDLENGHTDMKACWILHRPIATFLPLPERRTFTMSASTEITLLTHGCFSAAA